ncbi:MAG: carboxypeptidase-like regulatory protein [Bacteroidetes bacterium]|nr:carboxypeptidase-like regulatory protein [Bacteroidota bacterium]
MLKKIPLLLLFLLLGFTVHAQETVISGRVTEKGTNAGIPFVNIYFKGTFTGTVTDFEGYYSLKTNAPKDSIFVSQIGYKSRAKAVKKGQKQTIDFLLSPEALTLGTVEVRATDEENPAWAIIRKAQANKAKYNRDNLKSVQYTSYTKQEADVDNITPRMRKWKIFRPFVTMWDSLDLLVNDESRANLPVMMSEVISDIYSYQDVKKRHEDVTAEKIKFVGMKDGNAAASLTGTDFQNYNFANNSVAIQGKDILSPIADNAFLFYNYYLLDTVYIDSLRCFKIDCRPRNKKDLCYSGTLWIADSSFAIKQLDLGITPDVNLDWIIRARLQEILIPTEAGPWVPVQIRTMVDFSPVKSKFVSMVIRTYNSNRNYVVNKPKEKSFYESTMTFAEDAVTKDTAWWKNNRHEKLSPLESKSYDLIDTVRRIPFIKNGANILYFLFTGYKDIGPVNVGHYMQLYSHNKYEGDKIKLGAYTNDKFSKKWVLSGYGAYGFRDKGFKYNAQVQRIITRYPWSVAGVQYRDDIDIVGRSYSSSSLNLGQAPNSLFNTFSQINSVSKLVRKREARVWYLREFAQGVTTTLTFQNTRTSPLFPVVTEDQFHIFQQRKYSMTEVVANVRYSAKERYIQNGNERISLGNRKSPIITLTYTLGLKNVLQGDFNYHKVDLSFQNRYRFATLGTSQVYVVVGKVFSKIPYIFLNIPSGNETFFFANNTFNQMSNFEFVSDQYIQAFWQHHFNGLFFNRVPLLKEYNWREVVGINMMYGTLSSKNKDFNANNHFTSMDDVPYFEADLGIENIFNIFRIDYLYRLTYNDDFYIQDYKRNNPGDRISKWGIKVGVQFSL